MSRLEERRLPRVATSSVTAVALALCALASAGGALARKGSSERLAEPLDNSFKVQGKGELEVAFSPKGGGTDLVVKVIQSARSSIRVLAYSFTSAPIAKTLVDAQRRGVDVEIVLDKSQKSERYSSAGFVANSGIPVRIDSRHSIAHNKVMIVDGRTVEQGSFNYTRAAEENNGENVLVNWDNPALAQVYLKDWKRHWDHSDPVAPRY